MQVQVNDTPHTLDENTTLVDALKQWGYTGAEFAVAVNMTFIPKSAHAQTTLNAGDTIDIVTPMQGG